MAKRIIILSFIVCLFFWQFFLRGLHPIPADTIVGMYHPWRDVIWNNFTAGVPFKNFLTTDPVRQEYPWRSLAVQIFKRGEMPLWNPYVFSGTPLLGNFQTAFFYPLNLLFFLLPFSVAWSVLIVFQTILSAVFTFCYLKHLGLRDSSSFLSGIVFAFCGFSIAWMTWNTIVQTILWLPLILLSIEKIVHSVQSRENRRWKVENGTWILVLILALSFSLFAGHLQMYVYVLLISLMYAGMKIYQAKGFKTGLTTVFILALLIHALITAVQWIPTAQLIQLSARYIQAHRWQEAGWFIPWQNLIQFVAPDFFGNPTTLNYWGMWNYAEFVGYIGILPLVLSLIAMSYNKGEHSWLFSLFVLFGLVLALPTPIAKLPFIFNIPFVATAQPTRLIGIVDFFLACLVGLGMDTILKNPSWQDNKKRFLLISFLPLLTIGAAFIFIQMIINKGTGREAFYFVSQHNLVFPAVLALTTVAIFTLPIVWRKKASAIFPGLVIIVTIMDLFRFGWKFIPFTSASWIFPSTPVIDYLRSRPGTFRFMSTDSQLFPPNFSISYKLQTVDGYDPLYLSDYGDYVAAWIRNSPDRKPYDFNRIITPQDYSSRLADLANVRYVLSLKEEKSDKLQLAFQDGQTRVYENLAAFPRAFFVQKLTRVNNKQEALDFLLDSTIDLKNEAVVEETISLAKAESFVNDRVEIVSYEENNIRLLTKTTTDRFLVLTDNFYPSWSVAIDGKQTKLYLADYTFRGVVIPAGEHEVQFSFSKFL